MLYVFGNPYLECDSKALEVAKYLECEKHICTDVTELFDQHDELCILDVVTNIDEPMLISHVTDLKTRNLVSLHDFDVAYFLKLLRELNYIKSVKIIGVPPTGDAYEMSMQVSKWIGQV